MTELFPILAGVALGVQSQLRKLSLPVRIAVTLALGIAAAFASGELRVSRVFALLDVAQVALGAIAGAWVASRLDQRRARRRAAARAAHGAASSGDRIGGGSYAP